jgi:hypothetical protein
LTKELLEKEYAELKTRAKVGEKYGVNKCIIGRLLKEYNIPIKKLPNKYTYDVDFFTKQDETTFYRIG